VRAEAIVAGTAPARSGGSNLVEERHDGVVERVVAVARDHVPRARDVGVARLRHDLEQLACTLLAEQIAHAPAHEQRRDAQPARGLTESIGVDERSPRLVRAAEPTADERRVPVPVPATVLALPQVLLQAVTVARPR